MLTNRNRPRLLFLTDAMDHGYQSEVIRGAVRAARRYNVDLVILVGGQMVVTNKHLERRKFVYELPEPKEYDGVIYLGTTLSSQKGRGALAPLIVKFGSLPTVSIGLDIGKGSTVLVDNADGINRMTDHLLHVHEYKKFAFISGPLNNGEAKIRLQAFKDTLMRSGKRLPDDHLVEGAFTEASGEAAIGTLMDDRGIDIRSLDAIVAANDSMAVGAMDELKRREIKVPSDVAIVGFDDIEAARYADSPLTTVQQPLPMQGERAVQRLLTAVGDKSQEGIMVSPKLVIRRSCGCGHYSETTTLVSAVPRDNSEKLVKILERKRKELEADLAGVAERGGIIGGWEELLVSTVIDGLSGKGFTGVIEMVEQLVQNSVHAGEGLHTWTSVISALEKHLMGFVSPGTDDSALVEGMMHRARVAMSEAAEQVHATRIRELTNRTASFNEAASALLTTLDFNSFIGAAAEHLPKLGIETCSISLLEDRNERATNMIPLMVLEKGCRIEREEEDASLFQTNQLAPSELIEKPHAIVIEPMCFHEDVYGVAAFEYGPTDGAIYEQMGAFFSASLKAVFMSEENRNVQQRIETASVNDSLTGLYNKAHLKTRIVEEIARAQKTRQPFSLIVMDMDDFEKLNDSLGEKEGDQALIGVGETLNRFTEAMEIVARLDEDSFAVLLPATTKEEALAKADLFNRRIKLSLAFTYHGMINASFGIETSDGGNNTDPDTLLLFASRALSHAKKEGKDRVIHRADLG